VPNFPKWFCAGQYFPEMGHFSKFGPSTWFDKSSPTSAQGPGIETEVGLVGADLPGSPGKRIRQRPSGLSGKADSAKTFRVIRESGEDLPGSQEYRRLKTKS